jgi:serine/threonine protein phosphatase PrpC
MLEVEYAELTDPGPVRDHNEDYLGSFVPAGEQEARNNGYLFVLADGVGGHERGEVASRLAVETVIEGFRASPKGEAFTSLLPRVIQKANTRIYETGRNASPGGTAMATTVVVCALRYDRAVVAHVGDSRCYVIRHGLANQLTRDHTVVAEQMRMGILSRKEAAESQARHLLSRSLGANLFANIEITDHQIQPGDVLLLCSDGLHGEVESAEIAETIAWNRDLHQAAAKLLSRAIDGGGTDNVSLQLIRILGVERMGMYRGRPYKLR